MTPDDRPRTAEERVGEHVYHACLMPPDADAVLRGVAIDIMRDHAHAAVVEERIATGRCWRDAFKSAPIPLNVTIPQTPGNHEKALRRIFEAFTEHAAAATARAENLAALLREVRPYIDCGCPPSEGMPGPECRLYGLLTRVGVALIDYTDEIAEPARREGET